MITKWLDQWALNRANTIVNNQAQDVESRYQNRAVKERALNAVQINTGGMGIGIGIGKGDSRLDIHPDLNFKMYHAENGYVMEVRQIDRKTERQTVNLHVITEDQDLGESISHILTLESLKIK